MVKYLSDVLDTSLFEKGVFNVIWAPCGSGKTTAAINKIAPLATAPRKAIYLIDTRIGKERLSLLPELVTPYYDYADSIYDPHCGFFEDMDKVGVTTYAQFGYWCSIHPGFAERYELIICDEPHNLVLFSEIGTEHSEDINVHRIARTSICKAVNNGKVLVVGITATPKPLERLACPLISVPIDRSDLNCYTQKETIRYSSINSILTQIPLGKRGGLFVKHVKSMVRYGDVLRERGFNPLLIWSLNYSKKPMNAAQLAARQYIIEKEAVPDEYDVFLFNATAETSRNIYSHMDFFIAHNSENTHIDQSRGRYRGNLETLYVFDRENGAIFVPVEFMNRPLFMEDQKQLRDFLDIRKNDRQNHILSINDTLSRLDDCGYICEHTTKNRKKCVIIHKE